MWCSVSPLPCRETAFVSVFLPPLGILGLSEVPGICQSAAVDRGWTDGGREAGRRASLGVFSCPHLHCRLSGSFMSPRVPGDGVRLRSCLSQCARDSARTTATISIPRVGAAALPSFNCCCFLLLPVLHHCFMGKYIKPSVDSKQAPLSSSARICCSSGAQIMSPQY